MQQSASRTFVLMLFAGVAALTAELVHSPKALSAQSAHLDEEQFVASGSGRFPCSGQGIAAAIRATAGSQNREVNASDCGGAISIDSNLWEGVNNGGRITFGTTTFTVRTSQIVPSGWEISGAGTQTLFQVPPQTGLPNGAKNAMFINTRQATYSATNGHDTGISIHDIALDGNSDRNNGRADQGIVLAGADNSHLYNLRLSNFTNSCIDVRDGDNNVVEANWGTNCGATPNQWHAFGGGTLLRDGLFRHNKFINNHAGGGRGDHFDLFGQGKAGNCSGLQQTGACAEQNVISGNTSDEAGTTCFFLDTTARTIVSENICRFPRENGIAVTSGAGSQGAIYNIISANVIVSAGQNGILIGNVSNGAILHGNSIEEPGKDGIHLQDVGEVVIEGNVIIGPGQSVRPGLRQYSGVYLGSSPGSLSPTASNHIQGNFITDVGNHMRFAVYEAGPNDSKTSSSANSIVSNRLNCGSLPNCTAAAGSTGRGIQDEGSGNMQYGNVWNGKAQ